MAVIGYARISSKTQKLDMQIEALKKAGCEKIYSEQISTRKEIRHQFIACLDYLRDGDTLVVYSLCRLARNHKELLEIRDTLEERNVRLRALQGEIDASTPQGVLFFQIYASMLEFERNWNRERTMDGLAAARARGRLGGRKPKLNKKETEMMLDMYRSRKYLVREIADHFKIKSVTVWAIASKHGATPKSMQEKDQS